MSFLKSFGWVIAVVMLVACSGCWDTEIVNPSRPSSARGWEKTEVGSISVKGEFVLNKGEATDNGHVGLKVTDIYPAKYHFLDAPDLPKAQVQFFKVPDQTVICEGVFTRGGNRLDLPDLCKNDLEWNVIYIRDVNYDEGW